MPHDLRALQSRHSAPGAAIAEDRHGLVYIDIATSAATARVYLQGAHVTRYQPADSEPVLFLSARSQFLPGKPIRGGIPVIFPWFGPHPSDTARPAHGWARTSPWQLDRVTRDDDGATLTLSLGADPFALAYTVRVGHELRVELCVVNTGAAPVTFEEALHTYLAVKDVRQVRLEGLDNHDYLDKTDHGRRKTQSGPVTFTGETDRVYLDTSDAVTVHDPAAGRRIVVSKEHSDTTVVWNPWVEKAKRMPDFGDDEWPRMLCVESANAAENAVTLGPGGRHTLRATVREE